MKFYFRTEELKSLETLNKQSKKSGKMAVLMGRRRMGKTSLALEFIKNKHAIYLFVAKKSEVLLCQEYQAQLSKELGLTIHGNIQSFKELFSLLMDYAKKKQLTLIIDEFQEFLSINPSIYSDIQCLWDLNKHHSRLHIVFIGSIYSMMYTIFQNNKEPLFGRADRIIELRPFTLTQMSSILQDYGINSVKILFEFYVLTGCVPKYLDLLLTNRCYDLKKALNFMLKDNSPFLNEGRNQLIEEFGKDYATYFSVLELISRGKTSSMEIQSVIQKNVSAYLDKLENHYHVVEKLKPVGSKLNTKLQKYYIIDNFLKFWFRFFHRNKSAIEIRNFSFIKEIILRDFDTFSGRLLEKLFKELMADSQKYSEIGSYWERGAQNEIDIVAINELEKKLVLAEVKKNKQRNSLLRLEQRSTKLLKQYPDYEVNYLRLSVEDINNFLHT